MAEKSIHQEVAEAVTKKTPPATRKRLTLTTKSSYTIVADETGWVARITAKVAEFNKKRIEPKALADAGMSEVGKDEFHRLHVAGAPAVPASGDSEKAEAPSGPGVAELAKAVGIAAKPVKS